MSAQLLTNGFPFPAMGLSFFLFVVIFVLFCFPKTLLILLCSPAWPWTHNLLPQFPKCTVTSSSLFQIKILNVKERINCDLCATSWACTVKFEFYKRKSKNPVFITWTKESGLKTKTLSTSQGSDWILRLHKLCTEAFVPDGNLQSIRGLGRAKMPLRPHPQPIGFPVFCESCAEGWQRDWLCSLQTLLSHDIFRHTLRSSSYPTICWGEKLSYFILIKTKLPLVLLQKTSLNTLRWRWSLCGSHSFTDSHM